MASTLDQLFDDDDDVCTQRVVGPATGGSRHSIAVGAASMAEHDPALKAVQLEALFVQKVAKAQASALAEATAETFKPRIARFHSLPTLLYSETDDIDSPHQAAKSETGSPTEVKRKSLLEMIDADHPASPSKDAEGSSSPYSSPPTPGSPKRRRSQAGTISRPSLIEQETARLAVKAALAGEADASEGEYGSDTDTISGEFERYTPAKPTISYAPRASLIQLTEANFAAQLLEEQQAQQAFELQQQRAQQAFELQQQQAQQAAFEAQQAAAQQQAQFLAMQQQQQQQQLFAMQQQQQAAAHMPFGFAPQMAQPFMPMMPPPQQYQFSPVFPPAAAPQSPPSQSPPPQPAPQYSPQRSHHASSSPRGPPVLKLGQSTNLLELAMDKKGSRSLQDGLPKMSDSQLVRACDELGPHLLMLAKHPSANYVVSRLASLPHAHSYMINALSGHVTELLVHPQGSRVVQAAIAELPPAAAAALVGELEGHVVQCALDTHGSWGICAAYKRTHAAFILADVVERIEALSTQQHGCRVVQRVLAEAAANGAGVGAAAAKLLSSPMLGRLAMDPFGNYAVQVTLRHSAAAERSALVSALLPSMKALSTSKHGSNVAEALLTLAGPQQLQQARRLFFSDRATLRELTGHPFGNYVLQALLRLIAPAERAAALRTIETEAADTTFGRTIVTHFGAEKA